jgi:hypothetical protein
MIKRSCYQQASETIDDAMRVLELASSSQPPRQHDDEIVGTLEHDNRRIFNPKPDSPVPVSIKVVQHEDLGEGIPDVLLQGSATHDGYSVIEMESSDILHQETSAIFLYNSAICLLCQANKNTSQDIAFAHSQTQKAVRTLHESLTIFNGIYNSSQCPFVIHRILHLIKFNCHVLYHAMESVGLVQEAAALRTTLLDGVDTAVRDIASSGLFANLKATSRAA